MPDGFTDTPGGDDLDFRPLASQPSQRKSLPQPRAAASDGIDFQPSKLGTPDVVAARVKERGVSIGEARRQLRGEGYTLKSFEAASGLPSALESGGGIMSAPTKQQNSPSPQQSPNDIDFQPAKPARGTSQTPKGGEIDFQPNAKPATLESLYTTPPTANLTDRAARAGAPSPIVQSLAPKSADLTQVPVDPFTNRYVAGAPIRTEEEKQRTGVVEARPPLGSSPRHAVRSLCGYRRTVTPCDRCGSS
jgi:hypothetical protein